MKNKLAIRLALALCLVLSFTAPVIALLPRPPIVWDTITTWHTRRGQVELNQDVYMIAHIQEGSCGLPTCNYGPQTPGVWNRVDMTQQPFAVPTSAKVAALVCDLIITGYPLNTADGDVSVSPSGSDGWSPHIHLTFRAANDTTALTTRYVGDVETPLRGDGSRTNFSVLVPLTAGAFDWLVDYDPTTPLWNGTLAGGPAYGVDCTIQAWGE